MAVIALTGGIACGKSTVAGMLRELGAVIVDADEISRSLTAPGGKALPMLREAFGDGIFAGDGTLDRAALAKIVFSDEARREKLNDLLHPMIRAEMSRQAKEGMESGAKAVVLDVPLLFEANMQDMAQTVVCVCAPEEIQIARMASRNGYSRQEALSRIRSQMPLGDKMRLSDVTLDTNKSLDDLRQDVRRLFESWLSDAPICFDARQCR